eukprot:3483689-Pyramimonas_sp.AAC.1
MCVRVYSKATVHRGPQEATKIAPRRPKASKTLQDGLKWPQDSPRGRGGCAIAVAVAVAVAAVA